MCGVCGCVGVGKCWVCESVGCGKCGCLWVRVGVGEGVVCICQGDWNLFGCLYHRDISLKTGADIGVVS